MHAFALIRANASDPSDYQAAITHPQSLYFKDEEDEVSFPPVVVSCLSCAMDQKRN